MTTYNRVQLRGHVGAEPFIKYTSPTTCIARFSVATNRKGYTDDEGRVVVGEMTEWHSVVCFNDIAQQVEMEVKVGSAVELEGRLTYEEVRIPSGERIKAARVEADKLFVYPEKIEEPNATAPRKEESPTNPYGKYLDTLSKDVTSDEMPF